MPRSINRVMLIGHLGADAETRQLESGSVTAFSLATERKWKGKDGEWKSETDWHRIVAWNSDKVATYLLKGKPVYIEGRLRQRSYDKDGEKRYVTEVVAENIILLGGGGADHSKNDSKNVPSDDDVPF